MIDRGRPLRGGDCDQTIASPASIAENQQRKEYKPGDEHQSKNQDWIPELPGRMPASGEHARDHRGRDPQRGCDLADLGIRKTSACQSCFESAGREMNNVKRNMPVNPIPAET